MSDDATELPIRINRFWTWFVDQTGRIMSLLGQYDQRIVDEITKSVTALCPGLQWEIGPSERASAMFAISPGGDRQKLAITRQAIQAAPRLADWELLPAKPRKEWKQRIQIEGTDGVVDCSGWKYLLTAFNNREFFDVTLVPSSAESRDEKLLSEVGVLLVEGELGEELFIERIGAVMLERKIAARRENDLTPIQRLALHIRKLTAI